MASKDLHYTSTGRSSKTILRPKASVSSAAICSLICSDFIFRSPRRGFGSLTSRWGTQGPRSEEDGRRGIGAGGEGTRSDTGLGGGATVCPAEAWALDRRGRSKLSWP